MMKTFALIAISTATFLATGCSEDRLAEQDPATVDPDYPPAMVEASFESSGSRLNALVYLANGLGPHPTVLLLHGYPGNERNLDIAQYLRRDGWNVFFFHYRGAWGSAGNFSFLNAAEDVGAALDSLRENADGYRADPDRISIVGHSMGGKMALAGSADDPAIECTVTLAAASIEPMSEIANQEMVEGFEAYADGLIMLDGHDGSNVLEQSEAFARTYSTNEVVSRFSDRKLLMLGARDDAAVPIQVHESYIAAFEENPDVALESEIYPTDHSFSSHRITISRRIADWLDSNCR